MKKFLLSNGLWIMLLCVGMGILLYPTISDAWNRMHQTRVIIDYNENTVTAKNEEKQYLIQEALAYNEELIGNFKGYVLGEKDRETYESYLNLAGDGVMGYVEIPKLKLSLPIYHGTDESVLQSAIGHLEWTSLPVGGSGSHCVISGHRGLPSARLFTDLDKLQEGELFMLHVLDEVLTYEVDQILIVQPTDFDELAIVEGEDYCTLMTCTPYGINTHRLLVRGHRAKTMNRDINFGLGDATQVKAIYLVYIVVLPIFIIWLIVLGVTKKKGKDE